MNARFAPHAQADQRVCVLEELQPTDVVMYDPDVAFVRQIERYQAAARSGAAWEQVRLYLVNYEEVSPTCDPNSKPLPALSPCPSPLTSNP